MRPTGRKDCDKWVLVLGNSTSCSGYGESGNPQNKNRFSPKHRQGSDPAETHARCNPLQGHMMSLPDEPSGNSQVKSKASEQDLQNKLSKKCSGEIAFRIKIIW